MLHLYYGKGKGKTSAALGLILRAAGHKKKIILLQFLKPNSVFSGEQVSLKRIPYVKQIKFNQRHPMFSSKDISGQMNKLKSRIRQSISVLKQIVNKGNFDILVCDEILNVISTGLVKESEIITIFKEVKDRKEIILTGRPKPKKLTKIADYITELRLAKHPFQKGILARKSIEY